MRTPVTAIQGYLGLLANPKTATLDDKARDYVTKAAAEATHLGNLFQDLLDTTKADDGRIIFHLQPLNTASLAATAVQDLAAKAASKNLTLAMAETKGLQPIFLVSADPDRLLEVLHNLIDNAIKYTNSGGITVAVTGDESMVAISVRDTGIGIAPDDAPHIFQKFYRIDNSDTRTVGGTGLGLYLTAQLVEKMRGEIRVESEPGKGSNFIVTMPRLSEADAKLASTGMALTPKAPGTVEGS
jgi:signal transduction histidine kinase